MHLILLESGRNFFQSAECAALSILAHVFIVWSAVGLTDQGRRLPADEREARVFFLLPPDRVDVRDRQTETFQWGKLGGDLQDGKYLLKPDGALDRRRLGYGTRGERDRSGARGQVPFGPTSRYIPDTAFSVLEVDETVERYESSAAPVYPEDLLAIGTQGQVEATYVVDTVGQVDTTTIQVMYSDDPRFTESVRTALGQMRFRPAKRSGRTVRQLVQQKFRFKIAPADQLAKQIS
jgi:TonB family protein